eukprot:s449_g9.t1
MSVECSVQHKITYTKTGKSWLVPEKLLVTEPSTNTLWLKCEAHCYGLVNILTADKLDPKTKPTISGSPKLKETLEYRNQKTFNPPDDTLFGASSVKGSRKKRKQQDVEEEGEPYIVMEVENQESGDMKQIYMMKPKKKAEDLLVKYTNENLSAFFDLISDDLGISTHGFKRAYVQSGKFKAKPAPAKEPEQEGNKEK